MQLSRALSIKRKDVVSLVGGGGKTTAMFRLADELVESGLRVVTTTTTRIFAAQIRLAPFCVRASSPGQALDDLRLALQDHTHVLLIGESNEEGKAFGVDSALVDATVGLDSVDAVINEADGSRMRPLKAPGLHEPVVPSSTTVLVPVAGIDAVGAKLDDVHVHRAERVAELAQLRVGATIEADHVARVLAHPEGGLKHRPPAARVIPLLNKVSNVSELVEARDVAGQLLQYKGITAVAIGAVKNAALPVAELHTRVAAIVLAAGASTRMEGSLKQLLPWGGSTLVRHTVQIAGRARIAPSIVVVGHQADRVERELEGLNVRRVFCHDWAQGRSASIRAGLSAVPADVAAVIFVNADQPFLTFGVIDAILLKYFQSMAPIVVPVYGGKTGSPVLFDRGLFPELLRLTGEAGGRHILESGLARVERVQILNTSAGMDLDTPADYRAALVQAESTPSDKVSPIDAP